MSNPVNSSPLVEIHVTEAWIRLIRFCQSDLPHGEITIKVVNSEPTTLIGFKRSIRFDKPETIPMKTTDFSIG